jgi:hypothetical protein
MSANTRVTSRTYRRAYTNAFTGANMKRVMQMLQERRLHPRYSLHFPVVVRMESKNGVQVFECEAVNVARNAMEISSDGALVAAFLAQSSYPHVCEMSFRLPGGEYEFIVECQLTTYRRLSQRCYHLAFVFMEYNEDCEELLAEHLGCNQPQKVSRARQA